MFIYLAARYSRYLEMQAVRADLEKRGHVITGRWINGGHQISDAGLSAEAKEAERVRFAEEDLSDLLRANAIVAFTEAPRSSASRGGRHVEFGIAIGRGMRVMVVGPRENVFCCLPSVLWYPDYPSFLTAITPAALDITDHNSATRAPMGFASQVRNLMGIVFGNAPMKPAPDEMEWPPQPSTNAGSRKSPDVEAARDEIVGTAQGITLRQLSEDA